MQPSMCFCLSIQFLCVLFQNVLGSVQLPRGLFSNNGSDSPAPSDGGDKVRLDLILYKSPKLFPDTAYRHEDPALSSGGSKIVSSVLSVNFSKNSSVYFTLYLCHGYILRHALAAHGYVPHCHYNYIAANEVVRVSILFSPNMSVLLSLVYNFKNRGVTTHIVANNQETLLILMSKLRVKLWCHFHTLFSTIS